MPSVRGSWTTCTPCSQKSRSPLAHSPHFLRCSCCFNLYNSQLHLSPPLSLALLVLVHSASRAAVVLDGEHSRSGRISMHPAGLLGRWVFYILAVPASPYFHVGNTNILWVSRFWWCRHIQIDFHTFHFPFLLTFWTFHFSFLLTFCTFHFSFLLTFCTCFFSFLLTFCTCFFSLLSTSLSQPSTVCSHSLHTFFNTFATTTWLFVATLFN